MSLLTKSLILADAAPETGQTRDFNYCVKISNLAKYPDLLFFAKTSSKPSPEAGSPYFLITADRCVDMSGYLPIINIGAIAKNKVTAKDLNKSESETILANPQLQKSLIKTKEYIDRPWSLPDANRGKDITAIYTIKSIDSTSLTLTHASSDLKDNFPFLNLIIIPLIGVAILGTILWKRRKKSTS